MGVDGALLVALDVAGPGAGGGAGVEITAGAGVEGGLAAADDDEVVGAAGAAVFGWSRFSIILWSRSGAHFLNHAHYEALFFNLVRLYRVGIMQDFPYTKLVSRPGVGYSK